MAFITWVTAHMALILGGALAVSESMALITKTIFPSNKGVSGVVDAIVSTLKNIGAKDANS